MKAPTRSTIVATLLTLAATFAAAQEFPSRPIKLIVPQAPGSGGDTVGRMLADKMAQELHGAVVVENLAGANGMIASERVAREQPNGYTLMLTSVSLVSFNRHIYKSAPVDGVKDFTFIAPVADASFVLVASVKSGIKSWADLVQRAKAHPDTLTFPSAGSGNSTHLYPEMIARRSGFTLRHIPYKGSAPALLSIVAGETDVMVSPTVVAIAQIQAGKVVPIAQSGEARAPSLANVPLLKEVAPDTPPLPGWYAVVGPAKMDPKLVDKLAAAVNGFLADPAIQKKLNDQFLAPIPGTPEGIRKRGEVESELWGGLIRELKIEAS